MQTGERFLECRKRDQLVEISSNISGGVKQREGFTQRFNPLFHARRQIDEFESERRALITPHDGPDSLAQYRFHIDGSADVQVSKCRCRHAPSAYLGTRASKGAVIGDYEDSVNELMARKSSALDAFACGPRFVLDLVSGCWHSDASSIGLIGQNSINLKVSIQVR